MADRDRIETPSGQRYVERGRDGKFKDVDSVRRASQQDQKRDAENQNPPRGQGNIGDREDEDDDSQR